MKKMSVAYQSTCSCMLHCSIATVTTIVTICNNYISPKNDRSLYIICLSVCAVAVQALFENG